MGKGKKKAQVTHGSKGPSKASVDTPQAAPTTTTGVAADSTLGYKLRVLLYDFANVVKDREAESRLNKTTDEHYISLPYFTDNEAAIIKSAIVDVDIGQHMRAAMAAADPDHEDAEAEDSNSVPDDLEGKSFHEVLQAFLKSFLDKRHASGDARPCGPHHLGPLYASLFGVDLKEIKEENFLRRLRRAGV